MKHHKLRLNTTESDLLHCSGRWLMSCQQGLAHSLLEALGIAWPMSVSLQLCLCYHCCSPEPPCLFFIFCIIRDHSKELTLIGFTSSKTSFLIRLLSQISFPALPGPILFLSLRSLEPAQPSWSCWSQPQEAVPSGSSTYRSSVQKNRPTRCSLGLNSTRWACFNLKLGFLPGLCSFSSQIEDTQLLYY